MRDPAFEKRVTFCGIFVHVGVELVAGQLGKTFYVLKRNPVLIGDDGIADFELVKVLFKWMNAVGVAFATLHPATGYRGQHIGRAL